MPRRPGPKAVAWRDAVIAAVEKAAPMHGADPAALLDSNSFIDTLDDLVNVSPTAEWFEPAIAAKVRAAADRFPDRYGASRSWCTCEPSRSAAPLTAQSS